jgi:putative ABC transport system substrate-binding protein
MTGLRELGYIEETNVTVEWRYSEGPAERFPKLAKDLVRSNVDLIIAYTTPAAIAAKACTSTAPSCSR